MAGEQRARAEHLGAEARRSPRRTSRACRGGDGRCSESPCSGRSGSTTRKRSASARRPAPTPCATAAPSAAARAAVRRRARGRRRARRRGGDRGAAAQPIVGSDSSGAPGGRRRAPACGQAARLPPRAAAAGRRPGGERPTMGRPVTAAQRHPLIPPREVDPRQELPALELEVLERWRERDVFAESLRSARGRAAVGLLRGAADRQRPARLPPRALARVQGHLPALSDDARLSRRAQGRLGLPRPAGRDRRRTGARHHTKAEIEEYGIARFNAQCRESVFAFLEEWNRLTERIGFWLDLEHAYRTLDESYIESVWWALVADRRARPALRGPQGRARTARAARRRCPRTRSRSATATWSTRASSCKLPVAGGEEQLLVWTTTPWTLPGNVAVAVSPTPSMPRVRAGDG